MKRIIFIGLLLLLAACDELIVQDISDNSIRVISPAQGSELDGQPFNFSWEELEYADRYRLIIVSPSFVNMQNSVADTILAGNIFRCDTLPSGDYQWRIQAFNSVYSTTPQVNDFYVRRFKDISGRKVSIIGPSDNAEVNDEEVSFAWEGLPGAEEYRFVVASPSFEEVRKVVADSTLAGHTVKVDIPDGSYQWRVFGFNGEYASGSDTYSFAVRTVEDISGSRIRITVPKDKASIGNGKVTFSWETVRGAESYRLVLASPTLDDIGWMAADTVLQDSRFVAELPDGQYEWSVQGINKYHRTAPAESFFTVSTVEDISDRTVSLISPAENARINGGQTVFSWEPVHGADNYRLMIGSPDFDNLQELMEDITIEECSYKAELRDGDYQWRVQAMNLHYTTQPATRSFSIAADADIGRETITVIAPAHNAELPGGNVSFAWERLPGADNYRLMIVSPSFNNIQHLVEDITTEGTSVRQELPAGSYQWRIQAMNSVSQTVPQTYSLRITDGNDIRGKKVNVIVPRQDAELEAGDILFYWDRMPGAEKYKVVIVSPSFGSPAAITDEREVTGNSYSVNLPPGRYEWRIQAVNENYRSLEHTVGFIVR